MLVPTNICRDKQEFVMTKVFLSFVKKSMLVSTKTKHVFVVTKVSLVNYVFRDEYFSGQTFCRDNMFVATEKLSRQT